MPQTHTVEILKFQYSIVWELTTKIVSQWFRLTNSEAVPPSSNLHYHWFHVVRPKTSESSLSTMIELVCIDWTGLG